MNISSLQFMLLSILLFASNVVCHPYNLLDDEVEDDLDTCEDPDDDDQLDYNLIHDQALLKLRLVEDIMKRDGVIEKVSESGREVMRKKRDGYDDHDDNIVVRCKHSYTGDNEIF